MDDNHKTSKSPEKLSYAIYRHQKSITPWIPDSRSLSVKLGFRIPKAGILDFTSKIFQDSGIRIPLHEARDY